MDRAFEPVKGAVVRLTIWAMGSFCHGRDARRDLFSRVLVVSIKLRVLAPIFGPKMRLLGIDADMDAVLPHTLSSPP